MVRGGIGHAPSIVQNLSMNRNIASASKVSLLTAAFICTPVLLRGAESQAMKTNWVERTITNEVEIRMPLNVFVNKYHTNFIEQVSTNFVDVFKTNHLTKMITNHLAIELVQTNYFDQFKTNWKTLNLTNEVAVGAVHTNFQDAYTTNWKTLILTNEVSVNAVHTNFVDLYKTNWKTLNLNNEIAIDAVRTNFFDRYHTNLKTLNITNWETVLVMKTNWVTKQVTNVVELDMTTSRPPAPSKPAGEDAVAAPTVDTLVLEASRTGRVTPNNLIEVVVRVRREGKSPPLVQRWRIERIDGSMLVFGQDQEFKRDLPIGKYKVEAKVQNDAESVPVTAKGVLDVTSQSASIEQKLLGKR
jgi:hypothetical protein